MANDYDFLLMVVKSILFNTCILIKMFKSLSERNTGGNVIGGGRAGKMTFVENLPSSYVARHFQWLIVSINLH